VGEQVFGLGTDDKPKLPQIILAGIFRNSFQMLLLDSIERWWSSELISLFVSVA